MGEGRIRKKNLHENRCFMYSEGFRRGASYVYPQHLSWREKNISTIFSVLKSILSGAMGPVSIPPDKALFFSRNIDIILISP